jgi:xylulose-5-phosphate/fructose-6-phosphate phosphoketolase
MSANPHANGGILKKRPALPDFRRLRVTSRTARQMTEAENTRPLGVFLRDVMKRT